MPSTEGYEESETTILRSRDSKTVGGKQSVYSVQKKFIAGSEV